MKERPLILFLEDVAEDFVLVNRELSRTGLVFEAKQVETREAFLNALQEQPPDLILSDHGLHEFDAFSALALAKEKTPDTPFIFVTGSLGEEAALTLLKSGATDFVLKHRLIELAPAVRRALRLSDERAIQEHLAQPAADGHRTSSLGQNGDNTMGAGDEPYRRLVESVRDCAIYMLDAKGRVATWNAGAEHIEGFKADEVIGKPYSIFFPPEEIERGAPAAQLQRAAAAGHSEREGWSVRKGGSRFWSTSSLSAVRDEQGNLQSFSKVARDLTEIKLAQDQLRELNVELEQRVAQRTAELQAANKEMQAFSYSVSHDLRAPLRHIDGFLDMLKQSLGNNLEPVSREYLGIISESARRMARLIDALLAFSRLGSAPMRQAPVNMTGAARAAMHDLHNDMEGRDIELVMGDLPAVIGDPSLLRQVFLNLFSNALKFTRSRPRVRIEIGSTCAAQETVFFVRDNGIGFDMQYAGKLFGVFQRLHGTSEFEGSGIGLANVRRIIQRHGGRTWTEGVADQGATFYFSVPNSNRMERGAPVKD